MKPLFITLLLAATTATATAQLTLGDRAAVRAATMGQTGALKAPARALAPTMALARVDADGKEALEDAGACVTALRGDFVVVTAPLDEMEALSRLPGVRRLELSRERPVAMDLARTASGVAAVHAGQEGLSQPFTGRGVVAGIVDQGLDANHINFKDADGQSRLGYLAHVYLDQTSRDGWTGNEYDRDNIWRFDTDTYSNYHATHTMGILGGSYAEGGLHGVATGADIAASCGDLNDALISIGIERILDYAAWRKEPAVISLSIGSNTGAHSAQALMNQYLDEVSKEAIVVVAAGNEGDIPLALKAEATEAAPTVKTFILPTYQSDLRLGQVYVYSDRPFTQQAVIYNRARGSYRYRMPITQGQAQGTGQYYADQQYDTGDIASAEFASAFEGYVGVGWDIDEGSGQYYTLTDYWVYDSETNQDGNLVLGIEVTGEPGQRFEAYCDGQFTALTSYDISGWSDGQCDGTISDMACGLCPIVVGSYNTRDTYTALSGETVDYQGQFAPGAVTPFSSWGTLADGRALPTVCAPGAIIMSSCSRFYVEDEENKMPSNNIYATVKDAAGQTHYWSAAMGTSMSTPYVAGSLALWLEADPTLDHDDVREIIRATSVRDADVEAGNPVQWGAGKFDALAGLKEVLKRNGVNDVAADQPGRAIIEQRPGAVMATAAGNVDLRITALTGATVAEATGEGEVSVSTDALARGIYIVTVNNCQSTKITL